MGEIADMMLDGTMCQGCGEFLCDGEDGEGFPGFCAGCQEDADEDDGEYEAIMAELDAEEAQNLAALKLAETFISRFENDAGRADAGEALSALRAAIAKATGEA